MNSKRAKKILFVNQTGPYGTSSAREGLDVILMASAFDQDISVLFLADGIFLLKNQQDPTVISHKNFCSTYKALTLYGIEKIYVAEEDLLQRGLIVDDLIIPTQIINSQQIAQILHEQDAIMSF